MLVGDDGVCGGPCNAGWRKAQEKYRAALAQYDEQKAYRLPGEPEPQMPEAPETRAWYGDPWCGRCKTRIRAELAELDDLASILAAFADGHRPSTELKPHVGGSKSSPSPSPVTDALDEMASVLRGWESALTGTDPAARRGYLAMEITTTIASLLARFDLLITHPDLAADFGTEISGWHRQLRQRGKSGTARHRMPMPCPRCGHYSLVTEDGASYIECTRRDECGRLLSRDDYDAEYEEWEKTRSHAAGLAAS
jgi:hypothetical protein